MRHAIWTLRSWSLCLASAGLHVAALAQLPSAPPAAPTVPGSPLAPAQAGAPAANVGARFVEACNQSLERGVTDLGCQGPIYRNELERLKREALTTQNPQLLSFVGDAYENPRSGLGDIGQAYRWYLLAAVRGDPRAMQRLTEMNRKGQGVPKDSVKALGYARLLERMAQPNSDPQRHAVTVINELGSEMAVEEVALAERFSAELEARIQRQATGQAMGDMGDMGDVGGPPRPAMSPARPGGGLPGISSVPRNIVVTPSSSGTPAGGGLPGLPGKAAPQ